MSEAVGPPDEAFWNRYNSRAELPLSTVLSVLLHVAAGALIIFGLFRLMNTGEDRATVPVKMIDVDGGIDDAGGGKMGSGGTENPLAEENRQPTQAAIDTLPSPQLLPEIKTNLKLAIQTVDPSADLPISDVNAVALASTAKTLRDKLLGIGGQKGDGSQPGSGTSGQVGDGKGGTGANSARARSLRWVLRFRTSSGRDYLDQVAAMGAIVAVPLPPNDEKLMVFEDIRNPANHHIATDAEIAKLAERLKFSDVRRESVRQVSESLQLDFKARSFWAFFPKSLEEELARKEMSYRNRRSEDIEETVFQVTIRGGGYDVVVYDQKAKQ